MRVASGSSDNFGKFIVEHVDDLQEFVVRWRVDFIQNMKPNFMPKLWNVDRKIRGKR